VLRTGEIILPRVVHEHLVNNNETKSIVMLTTIAGGQSLLSCQFVYDRWHNLHYGPVCERVILAGCFGGTKSIRNLKLARAK
jgi:hypothetical protein